MADPVYFDSSVFLAIFMGEASGPSIKELLKELRRDKTRIYTSIVTIQEVSVRTFQKRATATDNYTKVNKLARIQGITKEIALTAAKLEAQVLDEMKAKDREDNKHRKWDCFHLATAMELGCRTFYGLDDKQLKRGKRFCAGVWFGEPLPMNLHLPLFPEPDSENSTNGVDTTAQVAATEATPATNGKPGAAQITEAPQVPCGCGCGEYPKDKTSRFLPGHDLRKAYKDSPTFHKPE